MISAAVREGLAGLETLVGIPGTLGGALRGNAGSRSGDVGQWTCRATVMDRAGEIITREREDLVFAYRESSLDELVILGSQFRLERDDPGRFDQAHAKAMDRQESGPAAQPSKRRLHFQESARHERRHVDRPGRLKGTRIGQAEVSDRHANFIVAAAGATSQDVLQLIDLVKSRVQERLGIELETEIEVW